MDYGRWSVPISRLAPRHRGNEECCEVKSQMNGGHRRTVLTRLGLECEFPRTASALRRVEYVKPHASWRMTSVHARHDGALT